MGLSRQTEWLWHEPGQVGMRRIPFPRGSTLCKLWIMYRHQSLLAKMRLFGSDWELRG